MTKGEHFREQFGDHRLVVCPKAGDRRVVGALVGSDHPEGDVDLAEPLDPPTERSPVQ